MTSSGIEPTTACSFNSYATVLFNYALISTGYPEYDGGAPLTEFEVEMKSPYSSQEQTYRGKDTDRIFTELSPGKTYVCKVRAFNRVGVSVTCFSLSITVNLVSCKLNYSMCLYKMNAKTEED
jgi:hypothetical protein